MSNGSSDSSGGFFSSGGSPALVLAFLAIGIFAGGLISMLFLRRFALRHWFRRSWTREDGDWDTEWAEMVRDGQARSARRRRSVGEKPVLWDLAMDVRACGGRGDVRRWEGMMVRCICVLFFAVVNSYPVRTVR